MSSSGPATNAAVDSARMDVEKSMLLASLQDYNEKLVLEVTALREENASLQNQLEDKDGILLEREQMFVGAKENIDKSIKVLKSHVLTSLRERDEAISFVNESDYRLKLSEERAKRLEVSLAESRKDLEHQKVLVSRSLRSLAKHKVASTMALQERASPTRRGPRSPATIMARNTPAGGSPERDEKELVEHMEVEHLLDTVGSTLQQKILADKCEVLEGQVKSVNTILKDERDFRLLLEQRQGASQRTISQLISLLFHDKSEAQRKKQLVRSIVASASASPDRTGAGRRGKMRPLSSSSRASPPSKSKDNQSSIDAQTLNALLDTNSEVEALRRSQFKLILSLLEDELHLLDMHYDRLLQEKERKKDEDTSRYMQTLIDRILEEMKEKGAQIAIFSGILTKGKR